MLNVENVATPLTAFTDRKSTRLHSSHTVTSYAVIYLKKNVTTFPASSSADTLSATIVWPAWVVSLSLHDALPISGGGGAAVMLKLALVAPVSPLALAVSV